MAYKMCRKCLQEKEITEFSPAKENKDKLNSWCKQCHRNYQTKFRLIYPEKVKERNKKQQIRIKQLGGPQVIYAERWYKTQKKYRQSDKGKLNHRIKQHRFRKERKQKLKGSFTREQWIHLLSFYAPNGKCLCCQKQEKLTIDHVIPITIGGNNTINNIQPLCKICNLRKATNIADYRIDRGQFAKFLLESSDYVSD